MEEWFEELPEQCPPTGATNPDGMTVYRFSSSDVPNNNDFLSQRLLKPEKIFNEVDECIARSLSVYDNLNACINLRKLPRHRRKFKCILEINLKASDGLIMKTFTDPNHYSWWRSITFNVEEAIKSE